MRGVTPLSALMARTTVAVAAAVVIVSALLWLGGRGESGGTSAPPPGSAAPAGDATTFDVALGDLFVRPSSISVPAGSRVVLRVTNGGNMTHDLQVDGGKPGTGMLSPGRSATVDLGVVEHSEQAWCIVPGHRQAGMVLAIDVTSAAGGRAAPGDGASPGAGEATTMGSPPAAPPGPAAATPAPAAADATLVPGATPPPDWHPFDAALAPAPGGTVHRITLIAEDGLAPVAPGVMQDLWTFNGRVPAPTLRGRVGDVFDVTLVNRSSMGHSLDVHAASQPMEDMTTIGPGQSTTEQFRAAYAGIFLYHCGTAPVLEHLANGMFGAVIVDPPALAPVAQEFLIVQSEWYPGPQGESGDYAKMLADRPAAVVFNGYVDQYLYDPLQVKAGERMRIWVLDAGATDDTSFHVVGAQFDTVFKEGAYLLRPGNAQGGGSQALDLTPGHGGFVEFVLPAPGRYELLDHHLAHAALGAAGYLVATR